MLDGFVTIDGDMMYLEDGAVQTGKITITDENENDYTFLFGSQQAKLPCQGLAETAESNHNIGFHTISS